MASVVHKTSCSVCKTERGTFQCYGCSQMFCSQHTTNHRDDVVKQLNAVEEYRDVVQDTLMRELTEPRHNVKVLYGELIKKIEHWEQESISKIRQVAVEAKNDLFKHTIGRLSAKSVKLEQLTNELQQGRKNKDFIETDLREWEDKLNQLKEELLNPPTVTVQEDYIKLVSGLRVILLDGKEIFERSSGSADFQDHGKVVDLKQGRNMYTEVRGKCEFTTGEHRITLKVEQLTGWILFGIISKSTPLQIHSYTSSSCYGWYNGDGFVYAAGESTGGEGSDALQGDTVHLVIDCDNRLIRLINERTNQILELNIDLNKCPFPWQLHLNLNSPPTRIRITS